MTAAEYFAFAAAVGGLCLLGADAAYLVWRGFVRRRLSKPFSLGHGDYAELAGGVSVPMAASPTSEALGTDSPRARLHPREKEPQHFTCTIDLQTWIELAHHSHTDPAAYAAAILIRTCKTANALRCSPLEVSTTAAASVCISPAAVTLVNS